MAITSSLRAVPNSDFSSDLMVPADNFILVIETRKSDPDELLNWCKQNRPYVEQRLMEFGAVLFRNTGFNADHFKKAADILAPTEQLAYRGGGSAREKHGDVYLSTIQPKEVKIPLHNELCYFRKWPLKVFFFCDIPAPVGGETPLANNRSMTKSIPRKILDKFDKLGVRYISNNTSKIWQRSFETTERSVVESFCRENDIDFKWIGDNLRFSQLVQGTAAHPSSGENLWFNSINVRSFRSTRAAIPPPAFLSFFTAEKYEEQKSVPNEALRNNAVYGDGALIEHEVLQEIRHIYDRQEVSFPWNKGDFVMVDNMLVAHGRMPFEGERRTLVSLKEEYDSTKPDSYRTRKSG